jgi:hypothetical protein
MKIPKSFKIRNWQKLATIAPLCDFTPRWDWAAGSVGKSKMSKGIEFINCSFDRMTGL